jgi:hypothetical protein
MKGKEKGSKIESGDEKIRKSPEPRQREPVRKDECCWG